MSTAQMLPALEDLDALGFGALETWGGATIDAGLRFLDEFPFDRLDALRKGTPNTRHMMLLRGQNIVQYANFPDDVVTAFVSAAARHGMDIFRIFDALNDMRNIATAVKATKDAGKHAQGTICYTSSPVHTIDTFIKLGKEIEDLGCDSICVKDMAGLIPPKICYDIVKGLKKTCSLPVIVHTHETAGLGAPTYYAAIEAGADEVDTSIAPFANGTGQPDTIRMLSLLEDHPRAPKYDRDRLNRLREHFKGVYAELSDYTSHRNEVVDTEALAYQVPGGMLSNFRNQLKEQKMEDRFEEVFREIPVVREALGWIPLVTPTSQIVGVQAMLNVKFGRWKNFSASATDLALGYYGRTPAPVDPEVREIAAKSAGKEPIECRPADMQEPRMEALAKELREAGLPDDEEHCVIHAMFPQELKKHFANKTAATAGAAAPESKAKSQPNEVSPARQTPAPQPQPAPSGAAKGKARSFNLVVSGKSYAVEVEELD